MSTSLRAARHRRVAVRCASVAREARCVFTTEEQLAIARPQARRITDEHWTIDDLVCLEELRIFRVV